MISNKTRTVSFLTLFYLTSTSLIISVTPDKIIMFTELCKIEKQAYELMKKRSKLSDKNAIKSTTNLLLLTSSITASCFNMFQFMDKLDNAARDRNRPLQFQESFKMHAIKSLLFESLISSVLMGVVAGSIYYIIETNFPAGDSTKIEETLAEHIGDHNKLCKKLFYYSPTLRLPYQNILLKRETLPLPNFLPNNHPNTL